MKLDCLLCLGGNGTHKTANLLAEEGLNIIALPKTIDNDIFGTDVTFGFPLRHGDRHRGHRPGPYDRRQPQPLHGGGADGQ